MVVRVQFQPCWTLPDVFTLLLFVYLTIGGVDIVARITWVLGQAMQYMGCGNYHPEKETGSLWYGCQKKILYDCGHHLFVGHHLAFAGNEARHL